MKKMFEQSLHPEYITDEKGNRKSVVIFSAVFEKLMEDIADPVAYAERRDEPIMSHGDLLQELKRDGLL
uniref:Prevent-host-death family protein n=1 Tax=Candidatus Kentrum sp. MB TaxID=2138164 RepID=A0A451BAT1_9GAMM|nr:MAG: hypothetical protein BECKMB1821G_GA0114241_102440 [Candidatus Kentron sp. MB]VFK31232.1 MAG: hypothetical protein BECKMB1821I_GA0114274_102139 [Candidatus Kentron sp. MB]VFK75406.1 MAG: hypothetical protein BECKMB1821H_GA0114242_102140 [Candidatus Kentron sp. MB]